MGAGTGSTEQGERVERFFGGPYDGEPVPLACFPAVCLPGELVEVKLAPKRAVDDAGRLIVLPLGTVEVYRWTARGFTWQGRRVIRVSV